MHRQTLLKQLKAYTPEDAGQQHARQLIMQFVQQHPNCFERSLAKGHITGSAWLTDVSGDKALLTHHKKLDKWLQLGGHADGEADVALVALREAQEESGIMAIDFVQTGIFDLDVHLIPPHGNDPAHYHYDVRYWLQVQDPQVQVCISDESHDLQWFDFEQLQQVADDVSVLRLAKKWAGIHV